MERRLLPPDRAAETFEWNIPERFNLAEACCDSWARSHPDRLALIHHTGKGPDHWSYGRLADSANRLAHVLAALGVEDGDRVAILLPQSPEVLVTHMAAYKLGAIVLPLFTLFGPDALAYRLADSGAAAMVTDAGGLSKLHDLVDVLPALRAVLIVGNAPDGTVDFNAALAAAPDGVVGKDTAAAAPAVMIYTSGTTGEPKGVLHAHRFLFGHLTAMEITHDGFPREGEVGWTPADWAWIGGLMDMAMPCLYYGLTQVCGRMRKFDPAAAFELLATYDVTAAFLPPTALKRMRDAPVPTKLKLRSITSGGESLNESLLEWGRSALGLEINEIYGQTECNLVIGSHRQRLRTPFGAMGQAIPGHTVAVLRSDGTRCAPGELGEIRVKSPDPAMFLRYWNKPEKTAEKLQDGWLGTGDLGMCDEAGFFTFSARMDDVITSSGYRIGPTEIENCLTSHPAVRMAAVVGLPDSERTEAVTAFVVLNQGVEPADVLAEQLIQSVRQRISPHVAPKKVIWRTELPMTATGKIMRRALRDVRA
ncbi:MAG: AMP-binding protein [Pseudomonadota bacterium]